MNIYFKILYAAATLLVLLVTACSLDGNDTKVQSVLNQEELIKRGEYLVNSIGCDDCHSPKVMGPKGPEINHELRFSGYQANMPLPKIDKNVLQNWVLFAHDLTAAVGPWGVSFAGNISSDETGIGLWSEDQFVKSIKEGKFKGMDGGRTLLPPMPWQVYRNLTDQDLKAIFAYLKTTKPVRNIVPTPISLAELKN
ncbi:MAG: c-type cytochrome [Bacteroidetes bacterium]|nr:c-type cytochrome [Bacteroidota bacterium]